MTRKPTPICPRGRLAPGRAGGAATVLIGTVTAIALLVLALWLLVRSGETPPVVAPVSAGQPVAPAGGLTLFCAAGLKPPVERLIEAYRTRYGVTVHVQYEGSGSLLAKLAVGADADLFIAADAKTLDDARERTLVAEIMPLLSQRPVLAVAAGNPKGIAGVADLLKPGVRFGLCGVQASVGKVAQELFTKAGSWDQVRAAATVLKPTVTELATDVRLGALDAGVVWDHTVAAVPGLAAVALPELSGHVENACIGVVARTPQPARALHLARFLTAPETGGPVLKALGYQAVPGDRWADRPVLKLYSGAVNRPGVAAALKRFEEREGVTIETTYNGCGILCADMKSTVAQGGAAPDAYYACDVCFVGPVQDLYSEVFLMTETDLVIAVPKGNPKGIATLLDLAKPGVRLGVSNAEQATLGYLTQRLFDASALAKPLRANIAAETPTGDLLIQQLRAGALDAAIVYSVNVATQHEHLEAVKINQPLAKAVQPFAIADKSPQRRLGLRLLDFLRANHADFTEAGFRWRGEMKALPSATIQGVVPAKR